MGTIEQKVDYLKETKQAIRTAIEEKGVSVADTDTFRSYASKIGTISVGGGGTKWYVGDFYDGQMYEGNNGDLFLNTGTTDQGTILQFTDGTWNPVGNLMGPQGSQGAQGLSGASEPVGSIILWGGDSVPDNYLPCVGSAVSRTEYSDLFSVIGTQFGEGDGSTTFNLPDFSGLAPVGIDDSDTNFNAVGKTYGEKTHTLTKAETPSLTGSIQTRQQNDNNTIDIYPTGSAAESVFTYTKNGGDRWNNMGSGWAASNSNNARIDFDNGGEDAPHNNVQPSIAMKFYIKAYQATATPAQVVDSLDGNSATDAPSVRAVNTKLESITQKDNGPAGKYISLSKGSSQSAAAEKIFDVSWDGEESNNTEGILIKDGNMITCTQGSHTILINATLQCILTNPAVGDSVYIYIRKVVDGEISEFKTTDAAIRDPHISVIAEINAGESILIQSYATKNVNVTGSSVWNTFQIMLIN